MMTKYPVFRSLYKPLFMGGVPLLFLFAEIITVVILIALRLYVLIPLVIPVHVIAARCYRKDQYFLAVLMDVAGLRGKTTRPRRKSDEVVEEISDQAEDS